MRRVRVQRNGFEFDPIRPESTAALIAGRVREAIAHGHLKSGEQLLEVQLSKQFGVSRGILREAMQRLTQEGLLESRPNRGVFVSQYGPDEVFDIYTARLAIERAACFKVIDVTGRATEVADVLDDLTDKLETRLAEGADAEEIDWLDVEFHERMVEEADSERLNRMHATLVTESRMCVTAFEGTAYPVQGRLGSHRRIAQAIRDKDGSGLHRILAEHMDQAVEAILKQFRDGSVETSKNEVSNHAASSNDA